MPVTAKTAVSARRIIQKDDVINTMHWRTAPVRLPDILPLLEESEDYVAKGKQTKKLGRAKKISTK